MTDDTNLPPELEPLDRSLNAIRFVPRESLGPELLGRLRRGERPKGAVPPRRNWRTLAGLAATLIVAVTAVLLHRGPRSVLVDRCCYDLDGGGDADDGVTLRMAKGDPTVRRLRVYEDRDRSHTFSPGDVVRLERRNKPVIRPGVTEGLVTVEHCCFALGDGNGSDDALLVIGVPPDRVMMAAVYQRRAVGKARSSGPDAFLLR